MRPRPTQPTRVLVVDDSVVVGQIVARLLTEESDIEVIGAPRDGESALTIARALRPDVVILDVEMPGMGGLTVLDELQQMLPETMVIMFSHLTQAGAAVTIDALARGAADYVTKPDGFESREAAMDHVRGQLVPRIRALAGRDRVSWSPPPPSRPAARPKRIRLLAIAASTGGPAALNQLVPLLPPNLQVPVVIVQHMPPLFTSQFARRLNEHSEIEVLEAERGVALSPGRVVVAAGGRHLVVAGSATSPVARLNDDPPVNSCRPSADVTFRSAVAMFGGGVLGMVLTGMGQDGLAGATSIAQEGGVVFCQDQASSVVWGMPGAVANAGIAEAVTGIEGLVQEFLMRLAEQST